MNISPESLLAAIRERIKQKGICYSALSEKSGVPLSSIKRHLRNPSLGLDKIMLYSSCIDTDLPELIALAEKLEQQNWKPIRDDYSDVFYEHPYLLDFLYMITSLAMDIEEIRELHNLTDKSINFYIYTLEQMGYIEVISGTDIKFQQGRRFVMEEGTKLDSMYKTKFKAITAASEKLPNVCMARIPLTQEQVSSLEEELYQRAIEFSAMNQHPKQVAELKNIMLSVTQGRHIRLSETLPNIDGSVLKKVSSLKEKQ